MARRDFCIVRPTTFSHQWREFFAYSPGGSLSCEISRSVQPLVALFQMVGPANFSNQWLEFFMVVVSDQYVRCFLSYPQPLKICLNLRRQFHPFFVQVSQLGMDVAQRRLEVKILVLFRRRNAHVAAGRQAPVRGCNLLPVHQSYQPWHCLQLSLGEALLQPHRLPMEV